MKNKQELKKYLVIIAIVSFLILAIFTGINIYEYNSYTRVLNNKVGIIIEKVEEKYPGISESEIIDILNSDEESNVLKKYGIGISNNSVILENENRHKFFLVLDIVFLILSICVLVAIFLKYIFKKEEEIKDITKYVEELNRRNYELKIDSNNEDELSILKNEIYKTTIMLKEIAENSTKDKMELKKSLEDISHQLKTPITSILVMLDNLIDDPNMDKSVRFDFINDIKRNVTNINFLVQSLLKLSKFDTNTITFVKEKRKVYDILKEAEKNVSTLCDLKNVKINISGDNNIVINCDFMWQTEAITNIIKNCIEHSKEESTVDITFRSYNIYTEIKIKDSGDGISKKDIKHIFERFYKGSNASSESIGIGLALSKAIIEKDNGKIDVESDNNGTLFTIKYYNI